MVGAMIVPLLSNAVEIVRILYVQYILPVILYKCVGCVDYTST